MVFYCEFRTISENIDFPEHLVLLALFFFSNFTFDFFWLVYEELQDDEHKKSTAKFYAMSRRTIVLHGIKLGLLFSKM